MSPIIAWFILAGVLLLLMAFSNSYLNRLPLTSAILYLVVGVGIGPYGLGLLLFDFKKHAQLLEHLTEIAVVISLFTAGLKLHRLSTGKLWRLPISLATVGMVVSVALITLMGYGMFAMPLGVAILLGAILSPTDPVLASDVQVEKAHDPDRLRFVLTGEGCLNDGSAFPFVLLGLGLLGQKDLGSWGWRWFAVDLLWACIGALAIGYGIGAVVGRILINRKKDKRNTSEVDEFITLGLISISYGAALALHTYGFLAVFAAGFALRNLEKNPVDPETIQPAGKDSELNPEEASSYIPQALLGFNKQLERLFEVVVVVLFGALFRIEYLHPKAIIAALLILLLIRPLSAWVSVGRSAKLYPLQKAYIFWFGVRGVGSLYYYFYVMGQGLNPSLAQSILSFIYCTIVLSIAVHGLSVTPLMSYYQTRASMRSGSKGRWMVKRVP